jgi:hypothetical protein
MVAKFQTLICLLQKSASSLSQTPRSGYLLWLHKYRLFVLFLATTRQSAKRRIVALSSCRPVFSKERRMAHCRAALCRDFRKRQHDAQKRSKSATIVISLYKYTNAEY